MTKHRYVGSHAYEVTVGDKRVPVEPGEFVDLSDEDLKHENNQHLLDDGMLKTEKELQGSSTPKAPVTPSSSLGGNE